MGYATDLPELPDADKLRLDMPVLGYATNRGDGYWHYSEARERDLHTFQQCTSPYSGCQTSLLVCRGEILAYHFCYVSQRIVYQHGVFIRHRSVVSLLYKPCGILGRCLGFRWSVHTSSQ